MSFIRGENKRDADYYNLIEYSEIVRMNDVGMNHRFHTVIGKKQAMSEDLNLLSAEIISISIEGSTCFSIKQNESILCDNI
jgi:hypothetical protein